MKNGIADLMDDQGNLHMDDSLDKDLFIRGDKEGIILTPTEMQEQKAKEKEDA